MCSISCNSWLQETEVQFDVRHSAKLEQMIVHKPNHGVRYPEDDVDAHEHRYYRQLNLTPCTARELGLLADLIGWTDFAPVLLDMARRPGECIFMQCAWGWSQSWQLRRVWGGFTALRILSSIYERLSIALSMVIWYLPLYSWSCREGPRPRQSANSEDPASNGCGCCGGSSERRQ